MDDFDDDGGLGLPDDDLAGGPDLGDLDDEGDGADVELDLEGADDLTIFVQGDAVKLGDLVFAPSTAASALGFTPSTVDDAWGGTTHHIDYLIGA